MHWTGIVGCFLLVFVGWMLARMFYDGLRK
jgi:hypothetical protein